MPLLDHFRPPLWPRRHWEGFHHAWAATIVQQLNCLLPPRYYAEASIRLGGRVEIDVATLDEGGPIAEAAGGGGVAVWAPSRPTRSVALDTVDPDVFEILVYDESGGVRPVAAIELVSPSNKDRPASRRQFAIKCAAYLQAGMGVVVVGVVTERAADLHAELMGLLDAPGDDAESSSSGLYATAYRTVSTPEAPRLDLWHEPLELESTLPTLPLWIGLEDVVPLDLEQAYLAACALARIH